MRVLGWVRAGRDAFIGRHGAAWYVRRGMLLGTEVHIGPGCRLDPDHCWLISIGDSSTLGPSVQVLAHDASTKRYLGYTALGCVVIGARVFVGAGSTILPGVTIGDDAVVGAGSIVTKDVAAGTVVAGSPARYIASLDEYLGRHARQRTAEVTFDESWTVRGGIDADSKRRMREIVRSTGKGYVI